MHCPKCLGMLQEHIIDGKYPVQVCFVCHGIWFDKDELLPVIDDGNKSLSDDIDEEPDYQIPPDIKDFLKEFSDKVAQCPQCNVPMQKAKEYGVMLDVCPKCGGVWLDSGEIFKVRHHEWKDFMEAIPSLMLIVKTCLKHPYGIGLRKEFDPDYQKPTEENK